MESIGKMAECSDIPAYFNVSVHNSFCRILVSYNGKQFKVM